MPGKLEVQAKAAHGVQDTEQWGAQDPYLAVRLSNEPEATAATSTCMKGGTDPKWREVLTLPVRSDDPGDLLVQLFNQNRAAPDDLIGYGKVPLADALAGGGATVQHQVPLTSHPSGRQEGHVQLSVRFTPCSPEELKGIGTGTGPEGITAQPTDPLPAMEGFEPTTEAALMPPEASDLRRVGQNEPAYDRVHRPGYRLPPS